ncbi:DUF302 domain-containing protein [Dyella solisilvae]|uniref:DUF302 domain-containing protein n=1 Tax=Dyella solisilvae TaxID=1920168 RepID=A0A370K4R9_9GAMM|nr:DUF302 domain-containing protein [Dyella solisilvae]RDI97649.1 DUF302 domain-containing protein [Dyella solisilvae]
MPHDVTELGRPHYGVIRFRSKLDVAKTLEGIEQALVSHGVTVFARIDFSGDAARAGLSMRPEQMLIFGNPKAGTPLMQAEPAVGLDLPLKVLVWEDEQGDAWIACNSPDYIVGRHELPPEMATPLMPPMAILQQFAHS